MYIRLRLKAVAKKFLVYNYIHITMQNIATINSLLHTKITYYLNVMHYNSI